MRLQELRRLCAGIIESGGAARPAYSADQIIMQRLGLGRAALLYRDDEVAPEDLRAIEKRTRLRASGRPLSYVLHEAEFCGHPFKVGRGVLIPRPETELLVEAAQSFCPRGSEARFADWCVGSGCIAISLLLDNPALSAIGVDKSPQALRWAAVNRKLHGMETRLRLIRNGEPEEAPVEEGSLDFIIANPPYIPSREMGGLMDEVRLYEPKMALEGGADGADLYRKFFRAFPRFLKKDGMIFFETAGEEQIKILEAAAPDSFVLVNKITDYNGILRHLIWRKS